MITTWAYRYYHSLSRSQTRSEHSQTIEEAPSRIAGGLTLRSRHLGSAGDCHRLGGDSLVTIIDGYYRPDARSS